jgi:hypothetical protein
MSVALPINISARGPETFTASAGQTVFSGNYPVQDDGDVFVEVSSNAGATWTTQVLAVDYNITGTMAAGGFTLTFTYAHTAGNLIRHYGLSPAFNITEFSPANTLKRAGMNDKLDRLTIHAQELRRDIGRALLMPVNESGFTLPGATARINGGEGSLLGFDASTGAPILLGGSGDGSVNSVVPTVIGRIPMFANTTGTLISASPLIKRTALDVDAASALRATAASTNFAAGDPGLSIDHTPGKARVQAVPGTSGSTPALVLGAGGGEFFKADPVTGEPQLRENNGLGLFHIGRRHVARAVGFSSLVDINDAVEIAAKVAENDAKVGTLTDIIEAGHFLDAGLGVFPMTYVPPLVNARGGGIVGQGSTTIDNPTAGTVFASYSTTAHMFDLSNCRRVLFENFSTLSLRHRTAGADFYLRDRTHRTRLGDITSIAPYLGVWAGNSVLSTLMHVEVVNAIGRASILAMGENSVSADCERVTLFDAHTWNTFPVAQPEASNSFLTRTPGAAATAGQTYIVQPGGSGTSYIVQVRAGGGGNFGAGNAPALPAYASALARTTTFITDGTVSYQLICRADAGGLVMDACSSYINSYGGDYLNAFNGVQTLKSIAGTAPKHLNLQNVLTDHNFGAAVLLDFGENATLGGCELSSSSTGAGLHITANHLGQISVDRRTLIVDHAREGVIQKAGPTVVTIDARIGGCGIASPDNIDILSIETGATDWDHGAVLGGLQGHTDFHRYEANIGELCDRWSLARATVTFSGTPGGVFNSSGTSGTKRDLLNYSGNAAHLVALAQLTPAANKLAYLTGTTTAALTDLTAFARTFLDDADAAAGRTTLALGTIATQNANNVAITGGAISAVTITGLADPSGAQDAATKAYVDAVAQGLDTKPSVKCATTANITLSGEQTLDGVLTSASRVLVKNQTAPAENGIYVSAAGAWARAADMNAWTEFPGAYVFVEQGTLYADTGFTCTVNEGGTLGVTAVTWTQFAGAGSYTAGTGLQLTGTQFSIDSTVVTLTGSQTLSNKTLTTPNIGAATGTSVSLTSFGKFGGYAGSGVLGAQGTNGSFFVDASSGATINFTIDNNAAGAKQWSIRTNTDGAGNLAFREDDTSGVEWLSIAGTGAATFAGTAAATGFRVGGNQVVGGRKTGWTAATGTATRATYDTTTVTTAQLAERVKALIDDLHSTAGHGLIGA